MTAAMPAWILFIGVVISATFAGVILHMMHYYANAARSVEWFFAILYVVVITVGVSMMYGNPGVVAVASILSVFVFSRGIFLAVKPYLPEPASNAYNTDYQASDANSDSVTKAEVEADDKDRE